MTKEKLLKLEKSMSQADIMKHAAHMCPVMRNPEDGNILYWIEPCEIHGQSCTYGAIFIRPVKEHLNFVTEVRTYHKYGGYYGFIRPSMDEAIFQCPKDILDDVVAVEFVIPEDKSIYEIYIDELDRHKLAVRYYTGCELPDDLKRELVWDT